MGLFATRHHVIRWFPAPTRRNYLVRAPKILTRFFCAVFFRERAASEPNYGLFSDCIHLAATDAGRMSQTKISSRLPGWRCGGWQKVARLKPTHLFSLLNSASLDFSLLIPADLPSEIDRTESCRRPRKVPPRSNVELPSERASRQLSLERCWSLHRRDHQCH